MVDFRLLRALVYIDTATPKEAGAQAVFPGADLEKIGYDPETIGPVLRVMAARNMLVKAEDGKWRRPAHYGNAGA